MGKKKLHLLYITKANLFQLDKNPWYFIETLRNYIEVTSWHRPGNIQEIISTIGHKPDFIFIDDLRTTRSPEITGLDKLKIPFSVLVHDTRYNVNLRREYFKKNNVSYIFTHYRDAFINTFPEYIDKMIWLPHYANTYLFKDYGLQKEIDILMMGYIYSKTYPLRKKIYETYFGTEGFVYHKHPGYQRSKINEKKYFIGQRYAKEINRSKIFITCNSKYNYAVMKYYEVLACKTLLLAPHSKELEDLGFIPGENFVSINKKNFEEKITYYLDNYESEGMRIINNGLELIEKRHSIDIRAQELINHIEKIIN